MHRIVMKCLLYSHTVCSFLEVKWNNLADSLPQIVHKIAEHKDLLLKMVYLVAVLELRSLDTVTKGLALMSTLLAIIQNQTGGKQSNVETGIMLALKVKEGLNADCGDLLYLQGINYYVNISIDPLYKFM